MSQSKAVVEELDYAPAHPDAEQGVDEKAELDIDAHDAAHLGGLRTVDHGLDPSQVVSSVDKAEEARILRKVDMRLVPLLSFLYL